jgi:hypothetical protein
MVFSIDRKATQFEEVTLRCLGLASCLETLWYNGNFSLSGDPATMVASVISDANSKQNIYSDASVATGNTANYTW